MSVTNGRSGREIAIVGMAGRYPDARCLSDFWRNIEHGVESLRALTPEQLLAAGVSAEDLSDAHYVRAASVLDDMEHWDAHAWGFTPLDAAVMDPQHRVFLECAWEALEDAGHTPTTFDGPIGVFAGCGAQSYLHLNLLRSRALMDERGLFLVRHTGNDKDFLATRVSYELDLRGPSISVQTACSTSLVAVHLAAQSLLTGECDLALAGGVTIELPHRVGYVYHEDEILSPDGHCRSFDAAAAGTVFGSGAGVVALRRLTDAERDGDRILAVIRGSAVNNDGANKVGYLAPSVDGQSAAIIEALAVAELSADDISYVEAHGTGTPVGDPIEVAALTKAFRTTTDRVGFCALGSVKPNIGHLDAAAGVAGLTKTVLALQNRKLPPTVHAHSPHPDLALETSPFFVSATGSEWRSNGLRRAGVSSLGVGGTNVHVVVEEAEPRKPSGPAREHQLLTMSAHTPAALDSITTNLADHLEQERALPVADVAFTLSVGRKALRERRVLVARSLEDARRQLDASDASHVWSDSANDRTQTVFCFAGGGAQFAGMGASLIESEPVYRAAVEACLKHLGASDADAVRALLHDASGSATVRARSEQPTVALPALFVTQYAMAILLKSWGVAPAAMIGHSMGEYTAAHLAGVFTLRDAVRLVAERGRLFEKLPQGSMLSVALPAELVQPMLGSELSIAAINAPELCVVSGPALAIEGLAQSLATRGVETQRLHINVAAHSAMLTPILAEFADFVRSISLKAPTSPFISNETGRWITEAEATDPAYWVRHLRNTVHFADGVRELLRDPSRVLVEVGPGRVLTSLARQQPTWTAQHLTLNTMRGPGEEGDDQRSALCALGRLWARGVAVDWTAYWSDEQRQRVALPTYPWERQRHWIDAPVQSAELVAPTGTRRARVEDWFSVPMWRQTLPPPSLQPQAEHVLIFADTRGLSEAVAGQLAYAARRVTIVVPEHAFVHEGACFGIRPLEVADHVALLKTLAADGGLPQRVLYAWGVPQSPGSPAELEASRSLHALLAFASALSEVDSEAAIKLAVLTTSLQRIGGESGFVPDQALLVGAAQVLPRELPQLTVCTIDVVLAELLARDRALATRIADELCSEAQDEYVAVRGPDRYVQELKSLPLPPGTSRLRKNGVYLITGGLSGIGFELARELARTQRARLVLISRTDIPARAQACTRTLEALGAEVLIITADVCDVTALRTALGRAEARFGVLHGVFHAAGVLADSLIPLKSTADAERVLAPKVVGTRALDAALADRPLDLFVLFSSISSRAGLPGQSDYAAANAFLDAFALERTSRNGQFTVAIAWSAWSQTGMSARMSVGDASRPLLGARLASAVGTSLYSQTFDATSQWMLSEHRLRGGSALLPGTAYLEIAATSAALGDAAAIELRDVSFRSPFMVPDGTERELRVHLGRAQANGRLLTIVGALHREDGSTQWQEHVTARILPFEGERPRELDIADIERRCQLREVVFDGSEQHPFVAFGARWRNLRRVRFGEGEAIAELTLDDAFASDLTSHTLHPALMDMATAFGIALAPDAAPDREFYVPLSFARIAVFAPLGSHILSHARLSTAAASTADTVLLDISITDPAGHVLVAIEEFTMTRVPSPQALSDASARAAEAASDIGDALASAPAASNEVLEDGMATADGLRALELILAGPALPQIVVSPVDATAFIELLRARARAPMRAELPVAPVSATAPLAEIEAVLASHDSLRQGVVLQRPNRPGELKLVAYVVLAPGERATVSDLRRFLRSRLPDNLVPSTFVELDALPTQPDGSVDRLALPDPFGATDHFAAPQTPTEHAIAEIWMEVLGLPRVGLHDNFFDSGGHSLLSVRAITRLDRRIGVRLELSVMILQTLGQIAAECDRRIASASQTPTPAEPTPSRSVGQRVADAWKSR